MHYEDWAQRRQPAGVPGHHHGEYHQPTAEITAFFLEAFPEVPITGLVMRNITIDGVRQCLRSMNWKDAVVENSYHQRQTDSPVPAMSGSWGCPTSEARSLPAPREQRCTGAADLLLGGSLRITKTGPGAAVERPSPCLTGRHTSGSAPANPAERPGEQPQLPGAAGTGAGSRSHPAVLPWDAGRPRSWSGAASQ